MFPNKHVHVDPEDCPTRAELLPLKQKKQTITTETRKQKGENQSNQSPKESEVVTKSAKLSLVALCLHVDPPGVMVS